ncbi:MAG: hypothetical protein IJ800_05995, partial [Clostridia bacterium]|nr:hypothetical protein [Clostridia bacterium]
MKKKRSTAFKIMIFALITSFSLVLILSSISLAVYTKSLSVQRTISTYGSNGDRFSSNVLAKSDSNLKTVYKTGSAPASAIITICNYEQSKQSLPYDKDISYTITACFVEYDSVGKKYNELGALTGDLGSFTATIKKSSSTVINSENLRASFSGSLGKNAANYDAYVLTLDDNFVDTTKNVYVKVTASPTGSTPFSTLSAVFQVKSRSEGAENSWVGS